jgi:hypothetical protein
LTRNDTLNDIGALTFEKGESSKATLGYNKYNNKIYLHDLISIYHEIIHSLGRIHEHQRIDRNKYLYVNLDFVYDEKQSLMINHNYFIHNDPDNMYFFYDYNSIMHYCLSFKDISFNSVNTITFSNFVTKNPSYQLEYSNLYFSKLDIQKLNFMYKCNEK